MMNLTLQYLLQQFGVGVAAITGVLAARGKKVDLFGVIVLAIVTAVGGGTIRDCTIGDLPVFWVRDPNYIVTAVTCAVIVFVLVRWRPLPTAALLVADAFALALFTIVGLKKAVLFGLAPTIAVTMGVITGVAGGMIRDLMVGEIPLVLRQEIYLYATASFTGAVAYLVLQPLLPIDRWRTIVAVLIILGLRLAAIRWRLSLPAFQPRENEPDTPAGSLPKP